MMEIEIIENDTYVLWVEINGFSWSCDTGLSTRLHKALVYESDEYKAAGKLIKIIDGLHECPKCTYGFTVDDLLSQKELKDWSENEAITAATSTTCKESK